MSQLSNWPSLSHCPLIHSNWCLFSALLGCLLLDNSMTLNRRYVHSSPLFPILFLLSLNKSIFWWKSVRLHRSLTLISFLLTFHKLLICSRAVNRSQWRSFEIEHKLLSAVYEKSLLLYLPLPIVYSKSIFLKWANEWMWMSISHSSSQSDHFPSLAPACAAQWTFTLSFPQST